MNGPVQVNLMPFVNVDEVMKSVVVELKTSLPVYVLHRTASGKYEWHPVALGSVGPRIPIIVFRPKDPNLVQPFIYAEAVASLFALDKPAKSVSVLYDTSDKTSMCCRMGVFAVCYE
jgi:hypothetical protein